MDPLSALRHHVTGAIERGEKLPVIEELRMASLSYGVLPSIERFREHFERCLEGRDRYRISLNSSDSRALDAYRLGDGDWQCDDLYGALKQIVDAPGEREDMSPEELHVYEWSMDVVSSILFTLDFEWI